MANSMDLSSDSLPDLPSPSPLGNPSQSLESEPIRPSSPIRLPIPTSPSPRALPSYIFDLSSDPLGATTPFSNTAGSHRPSRNPIRKRGLSASSTTNLHINKEPRTSNTSPSQTKSARELVLQARDLLVQAYAHTKSRDEQSKLLDLLEVFREYTEKGRL
jgi:hypothetical protein